MPARTLLIALPDSMQRDRLAQDLNREADIDVLAATSNLMDTYNEVEHRQPKAVIIAKDLAAQPEFEVMRALFSALDVRWLVISGGSRSLTNKVTPKGSDLFEIHTNDSSAALANRIRELTRTGRRSAPLPATDISQTSGKTGERIVLVGSSTGGVDALITLLSTFTPSCPPTLIVQHTGGGFGKSLVRLLDRQCAANVELATHGAPVLPGQVLIAAGNKAHLTLSSGLNLRAELTPGTPVSGHMPSVDALFHSAVPLASRISAAILTGMGRDGASGLKALRDNGASTFAQDAATSVVYGMPKAAVDCGAAEASLPIESIGPALLKSSLPGKKEGIVGGVAR